MQIKSPAMCFSLKCATLLGHRRLLLWWLMLVESTLCMPIVSQLLGESVKTPKDHHSIELLTDGRWDELLSWRFESFGFVIQNAGPAQPGVVGRRSEENMLWMFPQLLAAFGSPKVWQRPPSLSPLPKMSCHFPGTVRLLKMTVTIISNYRLFCQSVWLSASTSSLSFDRNIVTYLFCFVNMIL